MSMGLAVVHMISWIESEAVNNLLPSTCSQEICMIIPNVYDHFKDLPKWLQ